MQHFALIKPSGTLLAGVVNLSLESRTASSRLGVMQMFENDSCPVRDELLGEMYRASEHGLPQLVASVAPEARAILALFCYRKSHLHSLAVSIAASCSQQELVQAGGRVGSTLYALSREPASRTTASSSYGNRKPITLSTKPLTAVAPIDDELDDEDFGEFAKAVTA
jgi:hypothetical protein